MRDLRERRDGPPPPGADKNEIRRYYGIQENGPAFARRQLELIKTPKE